MQVSLSARQATLLAGLGLLAVSALALPGTLGGREIFERDVDLLYATQSAAVARALAEGAWPLWNPRAGFGQPLLANPNVQVFYPQGWLAVLLPFGLAYALCTHLHLVLAGLGVRALALRLGHGGGAAWLAGALFVAAGPTLSFVNMWAHLPAIAWMPWVLLLADRALVTPTRRAALAWGAAAALQALSGSPDYCLVTHGCTAFLVAWRLGRDRGAAPWRTRAAAVCLAALVTVGLSAAQWLPSVDVIRRSERGALPAQARLHWSLPPQALVQVALPVGFDPIPRLAGPEAVAALAELWNPLLGSVHLGPIALALAAAGLAGHGRARLALLGLALAGVAMALGRHTPVYGLASALFPPLAAMRHPSKFLVLLPLGVALLAAGGFERVAAGHLRAFRVALVGVALLAVALASGLPLAPGQVDAPPWRALLAADPVALGLGAAFAVAALLITAIPAARLAVAGLAVAAALAFNAPVNPTAPPGFVAARPKNAAAVRALGERAYVWDYGEPGRLAVPGLPGALLDVPYEPRAQARVLALREYLLPPSAGRWGIAGSYDRDLMGFFDAPQRAAVMALRAAEGTEGYARLLQRGGVEVVVALHAHDHTGLVPRGELPGFFRRTAHVFAVPEPLPRAYAVGGVRAVASDEAGVALLGDAGFEPRAEVALAAAAPRPAPADFVQRVTLVARRADAVELDVEVSHPGHVVLLEAWDPGWRAEVDGAPAPVLRANGIFRAVSVAAGRHRVTMRYRPRAAAAGLALSLLAAIGFGVAWRASRP